MVSSMSTTNQLYLPKKVTLRTKFNFDSIFYVRYKSEEISPNGKPKISKILFFPQGARMKAFNLPMEKLTKFPNGTVIVDGEVVANNKTRKHKRTR